MAYKIAIIQRFLPSRSRGGAGHFAHGLGNALVKKGHHVTLFTQHPAPKGALYRVAIVPDDRPSRKIDPLLFPIQLARQNFSEFDLIHAQGDDQWIPRRSAPPVLRTLHGSSWEIAVHSGLFFFSPKLFLIHFFFYLCDIIAILRAQKVVAVSKPILRHYPRRGIVIGNGIDLQLFQPSPNSKAKNPTILFVGEIHTRKRGWLLLDAYRKEIRSKIPTAELWLVTPEKIEEEGVRWFGTLEAQDLSKLYQQAWVFCLPSSSESFGRPYIEAMACGTPVVATSNDGSREILEGGKFGSIVSDKDLGTEIVRLFNDEAMRNQYIQKGFERVKCYSWDAIISQYEKVYDELIGRK